MMKYFFKFKNLSFNTCNSIVKLINTQKKKLFKTEIKEKYTSFILNDDNISLFQIVPTNSPTHFYVLISNKRYRITKQFYKFLTERSKKAGKQDKFYTKPKISKFCVDIFTSNILIKEQDLIVEPSAGNGSFIEPLSKIKCEKIFLDIAPENVKINQFNFLE